MVHSDCTDPSLPYCFNETCTNGKTVIRACKNKRSALEKYDKLNKCGNRNYRMKVINF